MKKLLTIISVIYGGHYALSQDSASYTQIEKNSIYIEAFGQGFCWSLNYDHLLNTDRKIKNSYTLGFVYVPDEIEFGDGTYYGLPVSYNWLIGRKGHQLELGLGLTNLFVNHYWDNNSKNYYVYLTPKIGYRFQRPQGGLFFRATASPMIDLLNVRFDQFGDKSYRKFSSFSNVAGLGYAVFPWPGLSVGYTFK